MLRKKRKDEKKKSETMIVQTGSEAEGAGNESEKERTEKDKAVRSAANQSEILLWKSLLKEESDTGTDC